jgi:hypothetical protein
MLTLATLGMAIYGGYEATSHVIDLASIRRLEPVADLMGVGLGGLLLLAAAFVRVQIPGGIPLAASALLGLQALALHDQPHRYGDVILAWQLLRGGIAALLLGLAYFGGRVRFDPDDTHLG